MSEQAARETFKKYLKEAYPGCHNQRFEDRFHAGIPDSNVCLPGGVEWWVEAKYIKALPKWERTPVRVEIRREQVLWLNNRKKAGGKVLVLVRIGLTGWAVFDGHFDELEEGIPVEAFFQLAKWHGERLDLPMIFG
jgi:hypothetical protein